MAGPAVLTALARASGANRVQIVEIEAGRNSGGGAGLGGPGVNPLDDFFGNGKDKSSLYARFF